MTSCGFMEDKGLDYFLVGAVTTCCYCEVAEQKLWSPMLVCVTWVFCFQTSEYSE